MSLERTLPPHPIENLPAAPAELTVTSDDFIDGGQLPAGAGFAAANVSPHLSWSGGPDDTRSYLLVCHDPDAPVVGGFTHWAVLGVPASTTELPSGAGGTAESEVLGRGAITLANDFGTHDWAGCAPPEGDVAHRYVFTIWALDTDEPGLDASSSVAKAQFTTLGNILARGSITGTYQL